MTQKDEINVLQKELHKKLDNLKDTYFKKDEMQPVAHHISLKRELQGHFQKVYSIDWAGNGSNTLASGSQDGKIIIWNAETTNKQDAIPLKSCWVMTSAFEKTRSQIVASGGLDSCISIYKLKEHEIGTRVEPDVYIEGHSGYISCCSFQNENSIVASSGDATCKLWDINTALCVNYFDEHEFDVMSVDNSPTDPNIFVSGSVDQTCKIWDIRLQSSVATILPEQSQMARLNISFDEEQLEGVAVPEVMSYSGHDSDVNSVAFFPNGYTFGSGSDDATCRLWDMRCHQQINLYQNQVVLCGVTSLVFSNSGRILFSGYDDSSLLCWDTISTEGANDGSSTPIQTIRKHEAKVSSLSMHSTGKALATGSWDTLVKIFA